MTRDGEKVMTAAEAVARFVRPGAVLGMGGQNIGRCPMALTHEIIRRRIGGLTVAGCNLSISMDQLVGAGLVRRTLCGSGNLERFGTTFCWRRAIEAGTLEVEDYSHLAMVTRFLAGEMGVPFMPTRSLLGSDLLRGTGAARPEDAVRPGREEGSPRAGRPHPDRPVVMDNPWRPGERVALVPALRPDVSIVHVQRADPMGNVIIEGFATHEPEMIRASRHVIVSCEELVSTDEIRRHPERTTVPFIYVSAVVVQPFGAYPTSVYRYYDYDAAHIASYQEAARAGADAVRAYLQANIWECEGFDEHLRRAAGPARLEGLRDAMRQAV